MLDLISPNPLRLLVAKSLASYFAQGLVKGDASQNPSAEMLYPIIERPAETKWGDFAFPCFRFAKSCQLAPPQVALTLQQICAKAADTLIERTEVVGAYLNIYLRPQEVAKAVLQSILSARTFSHQHFSQANPPKTMIEYSQPNTHKQFHVGHLRNVSLGDALVRMYRYLGYPVIAANYLGDEGAHIAKCLWFYRKNNLTPPPDNRGQWLGEVYTQASQLLAAAKTPEQQAQYQKEISEVLSGIESKSGPIYELWQETRAWSLEHFKDVYQWLGIDFDIDFFESELSQESQDIVDEYLKKGVFKESDGAIGIDLAEHKLGFMIVRKGDGNTLYATKDLVLARKKFLQFNIAHSIYIVGAEQNHHFRQVFKTLERMGFAKVSQCYHLSYGLVMLPHGKMSSRQGEVIAMSFLKENIEQELNLSLEKYNQQWDASELAETKHRLAVAAIKYGMLNTDPSKETVFNLEEWLSFEGNSGPYLLYSFARSISILVKGGKIPEGTISTRSKNEKSLFALLGPTPFPYKDSLAELLTDPNEIDLIRMLQDFNDVVIHATLSYKPSIFTHYLFYLCKSFNRFYYQVPVLKADHPQLIEARLMLVIGFAMVLEKGLNLIGIKPVLKM